MKLKKQGDVQKKYSRINTGITFIVNERWNSLNCG